MHRACHQTKNKTEGNSTLCMQHMTSVIYRALHNSVERERELEQATVLDLSHNRQSFPTSSSALLHCTTLKQSTRKFPGCPHSIRDLSLAEHKALLKCFRPLHTSLGFSPSVPGHRLCLITGCQKQQTHSPLNCKRDSPVIWDVSKSHVQHSQQ